MKLNCRRGRTADSRSINAVSFSSAHVSAPPLDHQIHRELVYRPFQFQKRSQLFIGAHDEPFFVAMRLAM
jgi:hypothetical protein